MEKKEPKIEFKYNEKGELESWKDGKCVGKIDQTPRSFFKHAFYDFYELTKFNELNSFIKYGIIPAKAREEDGRLPRPFYCSEKVKLTVDFSNDVYKFVEERKEYGLYNYNKLLEERNIEKNFKKLLTIKEGQYDELGLLAIIVAIVRSERISEGLIVESFEIGLMQKLLSELRRIDLINHDK